MTAVFSERRVGENPFCAIWKPVNPLLSTVKRNRYNAQRISVASSIGGPSPSGPVRGSGSVFGASKFSLLCATSPGEMSTGTIRARSSSPSSDSMWFYDTVYLRAVIHGNRKHVRYNGHPMLCASLCWQFSVVGAGP